MSRRPARFTQAEITRAVRGALAAGITVAGVQVDGDRIMILTSLPPACEAGNAKNAADVVAARLQG
ncbi:MAG TPA: hypothetical protein VMU78_06700 [Methylocella sp.]|nr:hypothetical protein [Methylocella sp.]